MWSVWCKGVVWSAAVYVVVIMHSFWCDNEGFVCFLFAVYRETVDVVYVLTFRKIVRLSYVGDRVKNVYSLIVWCVRKLGQNRHSTDLLVRGKINVEVY